MEILFLISGLEILLIMTFRILRFYKSRKVIKKVIIMNLMGIFDYENDQSIKLLDGDKYV